MEFGVLVFALGYEAYGSYALNLAISLKAYDPNVKICLVHDEAAVKHLRASEMQIFDIKKAADPAHYLNGAKPQYLRMKLLANVYSPFEKTMYMDADNIWLDKKVGDLFREVKDTDFEIGLAGFYDIRGKRKVGSDYTYWGDLNKIVSHYGLKNVIPQTVSGWFYFRKCDYTHAIFDRALMIYDAADTPCNPWAGGRPDEFCFNVALAEADHVQPERHVFYFSKINGSNLSMSQIYHNFWGIAMGSSRVPKPIARLYDQLVDKYVTESGMPPRHYHVDKAKTIKERQ